MFEVTSLCGQIYLGKQGENLARVVYFDELEQWKTIFGEGKCELLHQRNGDSTPYPVVLEIENNKICWKITSADTAIVGEGKCELRYSVNGVIVKSKTWVTSVLPSLGDDLAEPPEPQKAWVDQVLNAAEEVKDATTRQPMIGENKNWFVWNAETQEYVDTGVLAEGLQGAAGKDAVTDQTHNPESENAQSGKAVAEAVKDFVKNTDYANEETAGVVRVATPTKYFSTGIKCNSIGTLEVDYAHEDDIDKKAVFKPITPIVLKYAVQSVTDKRFNSESDMPQSGRAVTEAINEALQGKIEIWKPYTTYQEGDVVAFVDLMNIGFNFMIAECINEHTSPSWGEVIDMVEQGEPWNQVYLSNWLYYAPTNEFTEHYATKDELAEAIGEALEGDY
jgi:hypothetical protein